PNDTYIFYALLHQSIDTLGITFEPYFADIAELNRMAYERELDITKISYNALLDLTQSHVLLDAGGALGRGCGPLLIAKQEMDVPSLHEKSIAIPGEKTTANFLLNYYLRDDVDKIILPFDQIEDAVLSGDVDAGVIIHENRFTYAQRGLIALQDLGSHWELTTGSPIPLGGIIGKRTIENATLKRVDELIKASLSYAHQHRSEILPFIRSHAQEMEESVIWQHVELYVNNFSAGLGVEGRDAINTLYRVAKETGRISTYQSPFLT
ncbi:MAG: 1,4-dihydroxy-6-naphthoate synthase, partial [Saprospiraceae bacterium]|nr:1,4-dihydroxy-6-naphthoate synthase [Saprospiraceae bacterium]